MPPAAGATTALDYNRANHLQRKSLREVLTKLFRKDKALAMFLDEEMGLSLEEIVEKGTFKEEVFELIQVLATRGKLNSFMEKLGAHDDYKDAPDLQNLRLAWESMGASASAGSVGATAVAVPPAVAPTPSAASAATGAAPATPVIAAPAEPLERILDGDDKRIRPLAWLSDLASLRRRVCLLRFGGTARATALLIGKDLLLTAAYVVNWATAKDLRSLDAVFDFGIHRDAGAGQRVVKVLPDFVVIDPAQEPADAMGYLATLDYAVLRLAEPVGEQVLEDGSQRGWFALQDRRERLREGEELLMIHHPLGREMGLSEGRIGPTPAESNRLQHTCPSEPGSGGAPIMDATLRLVGLHELGRVAPSGQGLDSVQIGVRADAIARDLAARGIAMELPAKGGKGSRG
jgi:hypothetical protein